MVTEPLVLITFDATSLEDKVTAVAAQLNGPILLMCSNFVLVIFFFVLLCWVSRLRSSMVSL